MSAKRSPLLMSSEEAAFVAAAMGRQAYKHSKEAAAKGYDPETAARWGSEIATFQVLFWCASITTGLLAFVAISWGGGLTLWAMGHFLFIAGFACRLTVKRRTPPNKIRTYPWFLRTGTLLGFCLLWALVMIPVGLATVGHDIQNPSYSAPKGSQIVQPIDYTNCAATPAIPHAHTCTNAEDAALANKAAAQRQAEQRAQYCTPQWAGNPNVPAGLCPTNGTD